MTLTLEIAPEIERALEAKARRAGVPVADYAMRVLADDATSGDASGVNGQAAKARLAALDAIPSFNTRVGLPEIADTSRSAEPDIYGYSEQAVERP
jgi:hypothetical protein